MYSIDEAASDRQTAGEEKKQGGTGENNSIRSRQCDNRPDENLPCQVVPMTPYVFFFSLFLTQPSSWKYLGMLTVVDN